MAIEPSHPWPPVPTNSVECSSSFVQALNKYIDSLSEKKRKKSFVVNNRDKTGMISPESMNASIREIKNKNSQGSSRKIVADVLEPTVRVLREYNGIINTLASADPMPTAIIWGVLNIAIDCANRNFELFEKIQEQLTLLTSELRRITRYDQLYGNSQDMRDALCDTYVYVLQFWDRVHYACTRSRSGKIVDALTSINLNKLNDTIAKIRSSADIIDKEARLSEGGKAETERQSATDWRILQQCDRNEAQFDTILTWLNCSVCQSMADSNLRLIERLREGRSCSWLSQHPIYAAWQDSAGVSSVLWTHANPGTGKSTLCSYVIDTIQKQNMDAAVVYHFYRFDQSFEAVRILKYLALQLFRTYCKTPCAPLDIQRLLLMARDGECTLERAQELITLLAEALPRVYFLLDGLDEELSGRRRHVDLGIVLDFLVGVSVKSPERVRLWCSSQSHPDIVKKLAAHQVLDVKDQMASSVTDYLITEVSMLPEYVSQEEKTFALQQLQRRVEGNFLWAKLMMEEILDAQSEADMRRIIDENSSMDEYYKRFFKRFTERDQELACMVFALVAFARRPLKVKELNEAVAMLRSQDHQSLDSRQRVFIEKLQKLFAPLIILKKDSDSQSDSTCRLVHSTVFDFLLRHPDILHDGKNCRMQIRPSVIADACLLYLGQRRYAQLLVEKDDVWCDAELTPVSEQHFLFYSAKYWDKHLDYVTDPSRDLHARVDAFIRSTNFLTCVQTQSLWVDQQFNVFKVLGVDERFRFFRRVFPDWFVETEDGHCLRSNYHRFLHEWKTLLNERTGQIDRCWWAALGSHNFLSNHGGKYKSFCLHDDTPEDEFDGLCFQAISPSGNNTKILRLSAHADSKLEFICEHWTQSFPGEAPVISNRQKISTTEAATNWPLYASKTTDGWNLREDRASPVVFSEDCRHLRIGAQIFTLGIDGEYLAVRGLDADAKGGYKYVEELAGRDRFIVLATRRDVSVGKDARIKKVRKTAETTSKPQDFAKGKSGSKSPEDSDDDSSDDSIPSEEDYDDESDLDADDTSDADRSEAYESWSECSSENTEGSQFEDDMVTPWAQPVDSNLSDKDTDTSSDSSAPSSQQSRSETTSEDEDELEALNKRHKGVYTQDDDGTGSDSVETHSDSGRLMYRKLMRQRVPGTSDEDEQEDEDEDEDEGEESEEAMSSYYGSTKGTQISNNSEDGSINSEPFVPRGAIIGLGLQHDDEDFMDRSDDEGPQFQCRNIATNLKTTLAFIKVIDTSGEIPKRVFSFSQKLAFLLYDSPPVVHPSASLVVWPLSSGGILFADFLDNTYFVRKLRPSTPYTRHIFMKCRFSACGRFLHIVSLEGQRKPLPRMKGKKKGERDTNLSILVATYHLCSTKPSRSPPYLIHRAKVHLGAVEKIPAMSLLPYTLTWTPDMLFFTCSNNTLRLYRIKLFNFEKAPLNCETFVQMPRETINLPDSALGRKVYFFPGVTCPTTTSTSWIIVGATAEQALAEVHSRDKASPPIGCFFSDADLGGWEKSSSCTPIPMNRGVGRFDQHLEAFDSDEDCDLQIYTV